MIQNERYVQNKFFKIHKQINMSSIQQLQPIENFLGKKYKGYFLKQIKESNWQPFWQVSADSTHNLSFYGFNLLAKKYSNTIRTKVLYKFPVTLGYYRIKVWDQYKLRVPRGFTNELRNALSSKRVDMLLCPFDMYGIYQEGVFHLDLRHATVLIINKILKTVEFYDPMYSTEEHDQDTDHIHEVILQYMSEVPELSEYTFVSLTTMGHDGFQYLEELSSEFEEYSVGGLCFIWSLFYAELRLKYFNWSPDVLLDSYIRNTDMHVLKAFIHDYAMYIYEELLNVKQTKTTSIDTVRSNVQTYFENSLN